jgi:hypothetical protein
MEYLVEAKKFIERAHNAVHPEVIKTELEVAEWFLSQAINERDEKPRPQSRKSQPPNLVNERR